MELWSFTDSYDSPTQTVKMDEINSTSVVQLQFFFFGSCCASCKWREITELDAHCEQDGTGPIFTIDTSQWKWQWYTTNDKDFYTSDDNVNASVQNRLISADQLELYDFRSVQNRPSYLSAVLIQSRSVDARFVSIRSNWIMIFANSYDSLALIAKMVETSLIFAVRHLILWFLLRILQVEGSWNSLLIVRQN